MAPRTRVKLVVEIAVTVVAVLMLFGAIRFNDAWVDRHFLPDFHQGREVYRAWEIAGRIALALIGLSMLLVVRPVLGRLAARRSLRGLAVSAAPTLVAVALALVVTELVLRSTYWRIANEAPASPEPRMQSDARLGWTFVPSRTAHAVIGGRVVDYAFDARGYRVPRVGVSPDPQLPTILFAGESILVGYGLQWSESVPAQVQALTGVQAANAAVAGYSTDQMYMRLSTELPRFRRPAAVVMLFTPSLFAKNLSRNRPHLGPGLVWSPARQPLRLEAITIHALPYHSDRAIDAGVAETRSVLQAGVALARARGATPLIVCPVFGEGEPMERDLRRRILDQGGLPYVLVRLDPSWRVPGDGHPDARGAKAIAAAIAARIDPHRAGAT